MLCILAILQWHLCVFLCVLPFFILQQGYHNLSSLAHPQPKLRVAAVAAAVSAATCGQPFHPPTSQLMGVCQQISCWEGELSEFKKKKKNRVSRSSQLVTSKLPGITSIDALQVPLITDRVAHCDIIKLWQELSLIQPELALGHPGL